MTNDPDSDSVKEARERAAKFLYSSVTTNPLYQNKDVDESTESRGEQMERAMARNREWVMTPPAPPKCVKCGGKTDPTFKDRQLRELIPLASAVMRENIEQVAKWGIQEHTVAEWAVITEEEAGELQKELCNLHFALQRGAPEREVRDIQRRVYAEAIQTVALTLKVAEMMGVPRDA